MSRWIAVLYWAASYPLTLVPHVTTPRQLRAVAPWTYDIWLEPKLSRALTDHAQTGTNYLISQLIPAILGLFGLNRRNGRHLFEKRRNRGKTGGRLNVSNMVRLVILRMHNRPKKRISAIEQISVCRVFHKPDAALTCCFNLTLNCVVAV
jgi:hypothetical protein